MTWFPEGAWAGEEADAEGGAGDPFLLYAMARAYAAASWGIGQAGASASTDLWWRVRPVDDPGLATWIAQWDAALAAQDAQQARLTSAYIRAGARAQGVPEPSQMTYSLAEAELRKATEWLDSDYAGLSPDLEREVAEALDRMDRNAASLEDALRLGRLPWLHSPVIETRAGLADGLGIDDALARSLASVLTDADTSLRTAEVLTVDAVDWPTFATTGKAMLYKRVPQSGACGWCRVVATRLYSLDSFKKGRAWHAHCRCSWATITREEAKTYASTLKRDGNYYEAAKALGLWDGPTDGISVSSSSSSSAPRESRAAGQRTAGRLASVEQQIRVYERQPAPTQWMRDQLVRLRAEQQDLRRELGA